MKVHAANNLTCQTPFSRKKRKTNVECVEAVWMENRMMREREIRKGMKDEKKGQSDEKSREMTEADQMNNEALIKALLSLSLSLSLSLWSW